MHGQKEGLMAQLQSLTQSFAAGMSWALPTFRSMTWLTLRAKPWRTKLDCRKVYCYRVLAFSLPSSLKSLYSNHVLQHPNSHRWKQLSPFRGKCLRGANWYLNSPVQSMSKMASTKELLTQGYKLYQVLSTWHWTHSSSSPVRSTNVNQLFY